MKLLHDHWPVGIRTQLMLWYLIVFAVLMLLFGGIFYANLRTSLSTSLDTALQLRTQQIAAGITDEQGKIIIQDVTGELPGVVDRDSVQSPSTPDGQEGADQHADVTFGTLVRILGADGQPVYVTRAFRGLRVPAASITQPLHHVVWQGMVTAHHGQAVRLYSAPLEHDGKVYGVIQVGQSLTSLDTTLMSVVLELLLIGPFVLLLSAFGSYWLAARAFEPIHHLTCTARHIEASDLHQRVPVPRTRDEVQSLALTFNEMIERLDKAFARQRRFVADASHELRTPVAAIRSMTDTVLDQEATPQEYVAVLHDITSEAERLGHLISDLLVLARADEGQTLLEWKPLRLDLLLSDVLATVEALASERSITVEVGRLEPALVMGDEARLIQVILTLLDNARAYTNEGGKVELAVVIRDKHACLVVQDTGIGIAPEDQEHIFERFYRADSARARIASGTGLGLAIVEWVVRAHRGTITVESQVGQGSTFTVALPLAESASQEQKKA